MPGILPMKVIKVGSTAQSRIAQACDRCRSKKIRCDGIRPCCTQCANVGFECKTSDKLSRRAFPRGYTESLEEKVRSLEAEVRELKDLLDEKDEKIDMLSKIHSNRPPSTSVARSPSFVPPPKLEITASSPKEDVFKIQASPLLLGAENSDSYFVGASSGRAFVDALKRKIQENGKSLAGLNTDVFLNNQSLATTPSQEHSPKPLSAPPRLFSDKCVNVFFQEWAPLFPVLHKPTFLPLYEEYMSDPAQVTNPHKVAQLHLVFGIAGLSSDSPDRDEIANCESQWRPALETILMENTLLTLQCLVLALIHCISNGDYTRLQHYKGIAVGLSHRLGLHQSQKRFSFGALTTETRKKVFWTLYTVDCFSAAVLGLPKLLKEEDIHAEYPSDTDDEYVTEKGFQPTLPGECTRISSALALFRAARILSKVLEQNYPAAATHELSLQSLNSLEHELNDWLDKLPQHLRLTFVQDKPSTNITGSRSALLSLAFYYIKSLIHRPAVGSSLGNKSSPSVITLASSSKHMIQIVQLLEERGLSFSMCLNKSEMLTLCGLSLLYQGLDLKQEGKLMQEGQRLIAVVIKYLEKTHAPGAADFKKLAGSMSSLAAEPKYVGFSPVPKSTASSRNQTSSQIYQDPSNNSTDTGLAQNQSPRRATVPSVPKYKGSRLKETSRLESPLSGMDALNPPGSQSMSQPQTSKRSKLPNLDYLSLSSTPISSQPQSPTQQAARLPIQPPRNHMYSPAVSNSKPSTGTASEWEVLVGSFDDRSIYDAIYGGGPTPALSITDTTASSFGASWSPDSWDYTTTIPGDSLSSSAPPPQSVLSFSEESLSSGDEFPANELAEPALLFNNVPQDYNKHATQTPPDMLTDWGQASFDLNSVFGP